MSERMSARIQVNPRGPLFTIVSQRAPPGVHDVMNDAVIHALRDRYPDRFDYEATIEHVEPRVEMATATWDPSADRPAKTVDVEIDQLSERWWKPTPISYEP